MRDIKVRIKTLRRRARILYLPAYVVDYNFGLSFNSHGERRPKACQAIISGMGDATIAAERHFDARKAQFAAAAAVGGATALASSIVAPWLGLTAHSLFSVEAAFRAFIVASCAGIAANLAPELLRQKEEDARISQEDADMEQLMALGMGPARVGTHEEELLRNNAEWRRWEEADRWRWHEGKRRAWAEQTWLDQHQRRFQRQRLREYLDRADAQERFEADQEEARRRRWGFGSQQMPHHFSGGQGAGGRRDFLGYYSALGLSPNGDGPSQQDIKQAFRKAALEWHPDRQQESSLEQAESRFLSLKTAYEVLRDPEKRRQYDNGQRPD